ncbi:unnamed protein product [Caenorhabditis nigoni]
MLLYHISLRGSGLDGMLLRGVQRLLKHVTTVSTTVFNQTLLALQLGYLSSPATISNACGTGACETQLSIKQWYRKQCDVLDHQWQPIPSWSTSIKWKFGLLHL